MRVYFAGPLFTPYERSFIDECAARLRADGIDVFVPHENALAAGDTSAATIFAKDWQGLSDADAVVAVLDGPMVDDGTACEIGIFYALMQTDSTKKGILGLLTDLRGTLGHEGHGLNLFVLGCIEAAGKVCNSMDEVAAALADWRYSRCVDPCRNAAPDLTDESRLRDGRPSVEVLRLARDGLLRSDGRCRNVCRRLNAFLPPYAH